MNPYHHALSSAQKHGGKLEDYLPVHQWFDQSKAFFPDFRHRALRHHTEGIWLSEQIFGPVVTNSNDRNVPTRVLVEQHVKEDLDRIPTLAEWLECVAPMPWMMKPGRIESNGKVDGVVPCECETPGFFRSGVPGILAHVQNGHVAEGTGIERCDHCRRFDSDDAAYRHLVALGML